MIIPKCWLTSFSHYWLTYRATIILSSGTVSPDLWEKYIAVLHIFKCNIYETAKQDFVRLHMFRHRKRLTKDWPKSSLVSDLCLFSFHWPDCKAKLAVDRHNGEDTVGHGGCMCDMGWDLALAGNSLFQCEMERGNMSACLAELICGGFAERIWNAGHPINPMPLF